MDTSNIEKFASELSDSIKCGASASDTIRDIDEFTKTRCAELEELAIRFVNFVDSRNIDLGEPFTDIVRETKALLEGREMTCPVCKSENCKEIKSSNGILGPGHASIVLYLHCQNPECGNIFKPVEE